MNFDKYYKILELNNNADENEIKKAYKKLAIKWHPDKNQDDKDNAEKKFKEIAEAYEILTNRDKYVNKANFNTAFNPHDLFSQLFKDMNISNMHQMHQMHPLNSNMNVTINIPGVSMQNNCVMRSSSIRVEGNKKIETIKEVVNGVTSIRTVVTELNNNTNNNHEAMLNRLNDLQNRIRIHNLNF